MRIALSLLLAAGLAACSAPENETPADDTPTEAAEAETSDQSTEEETAAAAPPGTDIYLYALSWDGNTPQLGEPVGRIGSEGYDNQPFFTADGGVLYTSAGANGNTDIWRFDLASGENTQLTDTPDASEYSPKIPPSEGALSYIYQPPGGYAGNAYLADDGNANPRAAHALAPVGYYEFSGDMRYVATFYLGDPESEGPFTLQLIDRSTSPETVTQIAETRVAPSGEHRAGTGSTTPSRMRMAITRRTSSIMPMERAKPCLRCRKACRILSAPACQPMASPSCPPPQTSWSAGTARPGCRLATCPDWPPSRVWQSARTCP